MYENLKAKVNAYYDNQAVKFAADLETMTASYALDHWYYVDRMTNAAFEAAQAAKAVSIDELLPEVCKAKMIKKFSRENEKDRADALAKLEAAEACNPLESVTFSVEWASNKTWGKNPAATVEAYSSTRRTTTGGKASGCGYDKESAAIAAACNCNPQFMRMLYDHAENGGEFSYSVYVGKNGLPFVDGGCGMSCWRSVFTDCGYTFEDVYHGKNADVYKAYKIK